jgi:ATP-dependent Lhr-like helicase
MEDQGKVRRGYFVEGLSGTQFAHPGAVDRLRACRQEAEERDRPVILDDIRILAAPDPANPYGALIPWPETADSGKIKPRRIAGAWVISARGRPLLYVAPGGRSLSSFPAMLREEEGALPAALEALRGLPRTGRRGALVIDRIDGRPAAESPLFPAFREAGYRLDYGGLIDIRPDAGRR